MEDNRLIETEDQEDFEEDEEEEYEEGEDVAELIPVAGMIPRGSSEDEDYDNEDDDEDYETEYEDEEDYEEEEVDELIPVEMTSPADGMMAVINDGGGNVGKEESSRCEIDGVFCPICLEAWTSSGAHQICCLPCGHIFGLSCIKKWLKQRPSSRKCPQCKGLCTLKDVRVLNATRLCFADEDLHKTVQALEAKCAYLEKTVQNHEDDSAKVVQLLEGLSVSQQSLSESLKQQFERQSVHQRKMEELQQQILDEQKDHFEDAGEFQASQKHKLYDIYFGMREFYRYREWQHWKMFYRHCARANIPPPRPFPATTLKHYPYGIGGVNSSFGVAPEAPPLAPPQTIPQEYDEWYRSLYSP